MLNVSKTFNIYDKVFFCGSFFGPCVTIKWNNGSINYLSFFLIKNRRVWHLLIINNFLSEYKLIGCCPFFVDRYLILSAIDDFHESVQKSGFDLDISSKFLIGNGENGPFGKIGMNRGNNQLNFAKELRQKHTNHWNDSP